MQNRSSSILSPQQYADKILRLSHHIQRMAIAENWDVCARLEAERQSNIEELFEHPEINTALASISDVLRQVISIDSESMAVCEKHKHNIAKEIKAMHEGRRAVALYANTSG